MVDDDEPDATDSAETTIVDRRPGESKEIAACRQLVAKVVAARPRARVPNPGGAKPESEFEACCQKLADFHSEADPGLSFDNRAACCDALQWQGSMACTPWGPPTPPAMPRHLIGIA